MSKQEFTQQEIYHVCNKYYWFTAGGNEQYGKMFSMVDKGASLHEIALLIWLCTPEESISDIERKIAEHCKIKKLSERLSEKIGYAKTCAIPQRALYEAYGAICMARELNTITEDEFMELNHECVADGINNPRFFDC